MRVFCVAALPLLAAGCDTLSKGWFAVASLQSANGSRIWGRVNFHQSEGESLLGPNLPALPSTRTAIEDTAGKVFVRADINGLPPNRSFAISIHERGDCGANGAAAGPHFNPDGTSHGQPGKGDSHVGDMANLTSNGEGVASYSFATTAFTVLPGPRSIVGRAVLVHENPDDFVTQPDGKAGLPIACGLIRRID